MNSLPIDSTIFRFNAAVRQCSSSLQPIAAEFRVATHISTLLSNSFSSTCWNLAWPEWLTATNSSKYFLSSLLITLKRSKKQLSEERLLLSKFNKDRMQGSKSFSYQMKLRKYRKWSIPINRETTVLKTILSYSILMDPN